MIQIDELQIRMPGKNNEEAIGLGRQVAERLADTVPENSGNKHIPEIRVQLQSTITNDTTQMADRIAEQIIQQIKLASL
ncbi:MAG: hypothetical protein EOM83_02250 [Clostridia bacterium]|nr:hypothetical protein [Clostridia bacterium]